MSAQRGKKTRSAASRYLRYIRLTSTTGELRLQFEKLYQSKKKRKDTRKRETRAVGRSASTPHRLASTTFALVGLRLLSLHSVPGELRSTADTSTTFRTRPTRNLACLTYLRPL